jgi:hypothetical protein
MKAKARTKKVPALTRPGLLLQSNLRSAALTVIFFLVLTLPALLLLAGLATLLSALPALLVLSGFSRLPALLAELTALLTVFLHIVCHEHSPPMQCSAVPPRLLRIFSLNKDLVADSPSGVGAKIRSQW